MRSRTSASLDETGAEQTRELVRAVWIWSSRLQEEPELVARDGADRQCCLEIADATHDPPSQLDDLDLVLGDPSVPSVRSPTRSSGPPSATRGRIRDMSAAAWTP